MLFQRLLRLSVRGAVLLLTLFQSPRFAYLNFCKCRKYNDKKQAKSCIFNINLSKRGWGEPFIEPSGLGVFMSCREVANRELGLKSRLNLGRCRRKCGAGLGGL